MTIMAPIYLIGSNPFHLSSFRLPLSTTNHSYTNAHRMNIAQSESDALSSMPLSQPAGQPTNHSFQPQIFILCCAIYPDASWDEKMRKINWPILENLWVNTFKYRSTVNLIWIWGFSPSFSIQFQYIRIDVYEI